MKAAVLSVPEPVAPLSHIAAWPLNTPPLSTRPTYTLTEVGRQVCLVSGRGVQEGVGVQGWRGCWRVRSRVWGDPRPQHTQSVTEPPYAAPPYLSPVPAVIPPLTPLAALHLGLFHACRSEVTPPLPHLSHLSYLHVPAVSSSKAAAVNVDGNLTESRQLATQAHEAVSRIPSA